MPKLRLAIAGAAFLLLLRADAARGAMVYLCDAAGNVGSYDTETGTAAPVGSIAPFNPGQVLGLAYDAATASVIVLDRRGGRVYAMDGKTGQAALLFDSAGEFQGGAIRDGVLYGSQEAGESTSIAAFEPAGTRVVAGGVAPTHIHAMGVNPASGQLYAMGAGDGEIRLVDPDGTVGEVVVTATGLIRAIDDIDYLDGDFLAVAYCSGMVFRVDGPTGAASVFLEAAQTAAMGLVGGVTGVAVATPSVPEPASLALAGLGALGLLGLARRRAWGPATRPR